MKSKKNNFVEFRACEPRIGVYTGSTQGQRVQNYITYKVVNQFLILIFSQSQFKGSLYILSNYIEIVKGKEYW